MLITLDIECSSGPKLKRENSFLKIELSCYALCTFLSCELHRPSIIKRPQRRSLSLPDAAAKHYSSGTRVPARGDDLDIAFSTQAPSVNDTFCLEPVMYSRGGNPRCCCDYSARCCCGYRSAGSAHCCPNYRHGSRGSSLGTSAITPFLKTSQKYSSSLPMNSHAKHDQSCCSCLKPTLSPRSVRD